MWKSALLLFCLTGSALAQDAGGAVSATPLAPPCEACQTDEIQAGDYVAPLVPSPRPAPQLDPRGKPISVPVGNLPTIYHRPGAGVWLYGEANNNLYVDSSDRRTLLRLRRDF